MKPMICACAAALLVASTAAQTPQPVQPPTGQPQPEMRGRVIGNEPPAVRPAMTPCESKGGVIEPVVRFCPLPKDAPWPPPAKPEPKAGIFLLDDV